MGGVLIPAWILAPPTVVSADAVTNSPPMEDHAMVCRYAILHEFCKHVHLSSHPALTMKFSPPDINECSGNHGCAHRCTNTQGSYSCTCNSGYRLGSDGRSCTLIPTTAPTTRPTTAPTTRPTTAPTCGRRLTATSGSFQTPGWPNNYPQRDFQCEWTVDVAAPGYAIEFRIDTSAYGINGRSPCPTDYIEFFNGISNSARSLHKLCKFDNPGAITTTSNEARVVFAGSQNNKRPVSRVGVRVTYTLTDIGT